MGLHGARVCAVSGVLLARGLLAQEPPVVNRAAPSYWSAGQTAGAPAQELRADRKGLPGIPAVPILPTFPASLIGVTPCRIADTRDATRPPGYGPPSLTAGVARDFTVAGVCGIGRRAQAVSLNITVVNPQGLGYILIYPQGGGQPVVSTLNYTAGVTVANAAIVPVGDQYGITVVAAVSGTDLIIDTNGYYAPAGVGDWNTFLGFGAGNFTMTGDNNTAMGSVALGSNTTGGNNTALGTGALLQNATGNSSVALGVAALINSTAGSNNVAIGEAALYQLTAGSDNVAIGYLAGNIEAGDHNVYLANQDLAASESNTIRIGSGGTHLRAFLAGVRGVTTDIADAVPVVIDSLGQLGTVSSSARFKQDIADMADASSGLLKLRPVTFHYKGQAGGVKQFGMVAEEVEEVLPELVVRGSSGQVETVLYHEMPAMIVNELQKQQKRMERQDEEIQVQREQIAKLLARVGELEAGVVASSGRP